MMLERLWFGQPRSLQRLALVLLGLLAWGERGLAQEGAVNLPFDGGVAAVEFPPGTGGRYFRVEVPAGVLGWDIRITDPSFADNTLMIPGLVIRRDALPTERFESFSLNEQRWPTLHQVAAVNDWTDRPFNVDGSIRENRRVQQWGLGNPLEPGVYYIGVTNLGFGTNGVVSMVLKSRGIGAGQSIPVTPLAFSNGSASVTDLPPREAAYFSVQVPADQPNWKVKLTGTRGESLLMVLRDRVPNVVAQFNGNASSVQSPGKKMQKAGNEHYLLLPDPGKTFVTPGLYYLIAASEGEAASTNRDRIGPGASSFTLTSLGAVAPENLGQIPSAGLEKNDTLEGGDTRVYQFSVPPGTQNFEVRLSNVVGNPLMALREGSVIPDPSVQAAPPLRRDQYGVESGDAPGYAHATAIVVTNQTAGTYTLAIKARSTLDQFGPYPDASFTLRVHIPEIAPLAFDAGVAVVTNQTAGSWSFFQVDVPAQAQGWDLRLTNVVGSPRMAVRRDVAPISLAMSSGWNPVTATNWPSGNQYFNLADFTRRAANAAGVNEEGRIINVAMGAPLEAGRYIVGIQNTATNLASFSLVSRGIGAGLSIPVTPLVFQGGEARDTALQGREMRYYSVDVPADTKSWKLDLDVTDGEAMLVVAANKLPTPLSGRVIQKTGREHYLLLPSSGRDIVTAGTYYVAVVSEGGVSTNATRIGVGGSTTVVRSTGSLPMENLGEVQANEILRVVEIPAGAVSGYQFVLGTNVLGADVRIEDPAGLPVAALRAGSRIPSPGAGSVPGSNSDTYGLDGGETAGTSTSDIGFTVPQGTNNSYSMTIKARPVGGVFQDASFILRIRPLQPEPITFNTEAISVQGQRAASWRYFKVEVPPTASGWELRVRDVSAGVPIMVVGRDRPPISLRTQAWASPGSETNWVSGDQWAPGDDWTGRPQSADGTATETGRLLTAGMNHPLVAGTYFVGVFNNTNRGVAAYTIISRGIGDNLALQTQELAFNGGGFQATELQARGVTHFKVTVPDGAKGWRLKMDTQRGDGLMAVLRGAVPSQDASASADAAALRSLGRKLQKEGSEYFTLLPSGSVSNIGGVYFISLVSEGSNITNAQRVGGGTGQFFIRSEGEPVPEALGTVGQQEIVKGAALAAGDTSFYSFNVPEGIEGLEVRLADRTGNPTMVLVRGDQLPNAGLAFGQQALDGYGNEGGVTPDQASSDAISLVNPRSGLYTLALKARRIGSVFTNASFTLRIRTIGTGSLGFDATSLQVTGQEPNSWRFFRTTFPTNALGWDLRLLAVTSGSPRLVISRDVAPGAVRTQPWTDPGSATTWPSSNQWAPTFDWTKRSANAEGVNQDGSVFVVGRGRPIEPGEYVVGVFNNSPTNSASYDLRSLGIGEGYSVPVNPLAYAGGVASNIPLQPREAAYFQVEIPSNAPSWQFQVTAVTGEVMVAVMKGAIPHVDAAATRTVATARSIQKQGDEHFVLLPGANQTNLDAGSYFIAVVGEGLAPTNSARLGVGESVAELRSLGPVPVESLGTLGAGGLVRSIEVPGGAVRAFSFTAPSSSLALEVRLDEVSGVPVAVIRRDERLGDPSPAISGVPADTYGSEGGAAVTLGTTRLLTVPDVLPGVHTIVVKARSNAGIYSNATARLAVRPASINRLSADPLLVAGGETNAFTGSLLTGERQYFEVQIPATLDNQRVLGWSLSLVQSNTAAVMTVRKGALPSEAFAGVPASPVNTLVVPPVLGEGTWYVEVLARTNATFTLTSELIERVEPLWTLPALGFASVDGDTGVDVDGNPLPGDQGTDLPFAQHHLYSVDVSTNNRGLLRTALEALRGNPDLLIRVGDLPTFSHNTNGLQGGIADRALTGAGTEVANWVPFDGRTEKGIPGGRWYFALRASSGDARYRLRVSGGSVADLPLNGGAVTNLPIAAGDIKYFRFTVPEEAPAVWNVNFQEHVGNVVMHVRDTIPPGNGTTLGNADHRDWRTDAKNSGPYAIYDAAGSYDLPTPPLRPGHEYLLGFRALATGAATISFTSTLLGSPLTNTIPLEFTKGTYTNLLASGAEILLRVPTPADAVRFQFTSIHSREILVFGSQGAPPRKVNQDHFRSGGANSTINQSMLVGWPFVPGQTYYMAITNSSSNAQPFSITMQGLVGPDDDSDADGLSDRWEVQNFKGLAQNGPGDFDGDGISNALELADGTNPADRLSLKPRLTLQGTNGTITASPSGTNYTVGTRVRLTPVPSPGFLFTGWGGGLTGRSVPFDLTITTNTLVIANFAVEGDSLAGRIPLEGAVVRTTGSNAAATKEPGEPRHANNNGGKSIWWGWVAPYSSKVTIRTDGSSFNTITAVYTGTSIETLSAPVASALVVPLTFQAVAGTEYLIAIDGFNGASGTAVLSITIDVPPEEILSVASFGRSESGVFSMTVTGLAGRTISLEASDNLVTWTTISTAGTTGSVVLTDPGSAALRRRFYRAVAR